jgi:hypothetical protein
LSHAGERRGDSRIFRHDSSDDATESRRLGDFRLARACRRPSQYGAPGIVTFIINQDGIIYQKDLGKETAPIARALSGFNPEPSWKTP